MEKLNKSRRLHDLEEITSSDFNEFIDRLKFAELVSEDFEVIDYCGPGFYLFMSRVFQPLFAATE